MVEFHIKHWKVTTNGIKTYYVKHNGYFYIEVEVLGKVKRSDIGHRTEKLAQAAQVKTIEHYYKLI